MIRYGAQRAYSKGLGASGPRGPEPMCQSIYLTSVCEFVALGIQHAMHMPHIIICGLLRSTIFFHIF